MAVRYLEIYYIRCLCHIYNNTSQDTILYIVMSTCIDVADVRVLYTNVSASIGKKENTNYHITLPTFVVLF